MTLDFFCCTVILPSSSKIVPVATLYAPVTTEWIGYCPAIKWIAFISTSNCSVGSRMLSSVRETLND